MLTNYDLALNHDREICVDTPLVGAFPHTQISTMPSEFEAQWYGPSEVEHPDLRDQIKDSFKSHAIISGFSWTAGHAHYQGFWQDEDITYSIPAQLINTDGEKVQFACYQLNTVSIDPENDYWNKRVNCCYISDLLSIENNADQIAELMLKFARNRPGYLNEEDLTRSQEETAKYKIQKQFVQFHDISQQIML